MLRPALITFTGVDLWTNPEEAQEIARIYPVEFGILVGDRKSPRFPDLTKLPEYDHGMKLACHFCGSLAQEILYANFYRAGEILTERNIFFERAQINSRNTPIDQNILQMFAEAFDLQIIVQTRDTEIDLTNQAREFPDVKTLFDQSGGRGDAPAKWPVTKGHYMGFAGGIGPHNVKAVLESLPHVGPFWIDMETHVRDNNDRFDLNKVREVCEIVYDGT